MIKNSFTIVLVLLLAGELFAGRFQLSFGGGYGFAAGREHVGVNSKVNSNGEFTEYKDVYGSLGNGIKFDLDATFFFNDNFGLVIASGFSMLGGWKTNYNTSVASGYKSNKFN